MPYPEGEDGQAGALHVARHIAAHLAITARSTTPANVLAPLLCVVLFWGEAVTAKLLFWLAYMAVATAIRTLKCNRMETDPEQVADPLGNLRTTTWCVGLIGAGWGLGWVLLTPDLSLVNRMFYMFITTGAMYSGMFGYGVHWPTFYSLCIPIFVPAIASALWPRHGFPWPFSVGLATLFLYAISISRRFSTTFTESIRLRQRNEALYQQLATERDAQVAANVAKSRFLASASHDLRQPMHAVNFYLESLDLREIPAAAAQVITKIRSSITNLNQMFESLLDVSKLDSFSYQPSMEPFALDSLVIAIDEVGSPLAARQGIRFEMEAPPGVWLVGDEKLLRQVVLNLVTNAIYYTPEGRVRVVMRIEGGLLRVEVHDTGCGIREADLGLIFTEFYRVSETRALHEGLGLGLSIVRRLCDLIDARVEVRSQVGAGSVFTVLTRYAPRPARDAAGDLAAGKGPGPEVSLRGLRVAVVEDDPHIVEAYRQTLAQRGAVVLVLSPEPGQLGRDLEHVDSLDFIISDYRLGPTTGDAVIQRLRESFNREIPAIIVTADTSPGHIHLFRELNVPVLHKPISFQRVMEEVERVLGQARQAA